MELEADRGFRCKDPIAIIGCSCVLPGAATTDEYWANIIERRCCIEEVPKARFDIKNYFAADLAAEGKSYSKWGGFIPAIAFDPLSYGIPPRALRSISVSQLLALECTRQALKDAGYSSREFDRENTGVIFGASTAADLSHAYITRDMLGEFARGNAFVSTEYFPEWTEESFSGILVNVIAGRIANRFDLRGPNYTVDAACASSLAALDLAIRDLWSGRMNMAIVGGVDLDQTPHSYIAFSKTRALSPDGKLRAFDQTANGTVISEGAVVLVLKRLKDAKFDQDKIYAVIRSVESASDGRMSAIAAPNKDGQSRAIRRAYTLSDIPLSSISFYEAHATGTAVGDSTEISTISELLRAESAAPRTCAIGSVKALIGHCKAAAGLASILKVALALHYRTLPPQARVDRPLSEIANPKSPLTLVEYPQPWIPRDRTRRAGVSSFGFGGINYHAVLEEPPADSKHSSAGSDRWPFELVVIAAQDVSQLDQQLSYMRELSLRGGDQPLRDIAYTSWCHASAVDSPAFEVSLVASDRAELLRKLDRARVIVKHGRFEECQTDLIISNRSIVSLEVALLCPGISSCYIGMGNDFSLYLPELHECFAEASEALLKYRGGSAGFIESVFTNGVDNQQCPLSFGICPAAVASISSGAITLLTKLGVVFGRAAGHGIGELSALHASGALDRETLLAITSRLARGLGAVSPAIGSTLYVALGESDIREELRSYGQLAIVAVNSPDQTIVAGPKRDIDAIEDHFRKIGVAVGRTVAPAVVHSAIYDNVTPLLTDIFAGVTIHRPRFPVHSSVDGGSIYLDPHSIRQQLIRQGTEPIRFLNCVQKMYEAGCRTFVEIGPNSLLSRCVHDTLSARDVVVVTLDEMCGGLRSFLVALARLRSMGVPVKLDLLFERRGAQLLCTDLSQKGAVASWYLSGGDVWHSTEVTAGLPGRDRNRLPIVHCEGADQANDCIPIEYANPRSKLWDNRTESRTYIEVADPGATLGNETTATRLDVDAVENVEQASVSSAEPLSVAFGKRECVDTCDLMASIIDVIAPLTGYPRDVLAKPELDLEADLGIDSIKRINFLSDLEDTLPPYLGSAISDSFDSLLQMRTLQEIVGHLLLVAREKQQCAGES